MTLKIFDLQCNNGHNFEGWFKSQDDYLMQKEENILICPICNSKNIEKLLSFPHIGKDNNNDSYKNLTINNNQLIKNAQSYILNVIKELVKSADNVGENFVKEARKIYCGEAEIRPIIGKASEEEVRELHEEGIETIDIPEYLNNKLN